MNKFVIAIAGLLILTLAYLYYLYAAVQPKAHSFWQVSDENSTAVVPHSTWQNILSKYVKTPDETARFFATGHCIVLARRRLGPGPTIAAATVPTRGVTERIPSAPA